MKIKVIISTVILFLFAIPSFAQTYDLKYSFKTGSYYKQDVSMKYVFNVNAPDMPADMKDSMYGTMDMNITATNRVIKSDDKTITMTFTVDKISGKAAMGDQAFPTPDMSKIAGKKLTFQITNKGKILYMKGIENLKSAMSDMFDISETFKDLVYEFPAGSIKIGDSWKKTNSYTITTMGEKSKQVTDYKFTLAGIETLNGKNVAKITYDVTQDSKPIDKSTAAISQTYSGTGRGTVYIRLKDGLPITETGTMDFTQIMTGGPSNSEVKIKWKVNLDVKTTAAK